MNKNLHIVKAQSNCQFRLSMPTIGQTFSNNKEVGSVPNNGSKHDGGDDNSSVKMLDDDNSSFGSRRINPMQSAPRLDSYRMSALQMSAKRSSTEMEEGNGDKEMTPSDQKEPFAKLGSFLRPFENVTDFRDESANEDNVPHTRKLTKMASLTLNPTNRETALDSDEKMQTPEFQFGGDTNEDSIA